MGKSKELFTEERETELENENSTTIKSTKVVEFDVFEFIDTTVQDVEDGHEDALKAFLLLKQFEESLKAAKAKLSGLAIIEAATYNEKTFDAFGAKITLKNAAGRWNFDGIQPIDEAKESLKLLQQKSKDAYKLEQSGNDMIDKDTGEVVEAAQYTTGAEVLSISFKK